MRMSGSLTMLIVLETLFILFACNVKLQHNNFCFILFCHLVVVPFDNNLLLSNMTQKREWIQKGGEMRRKREEWRKGKL